MFPLFSLPTVALIRVFLVATPHEILTLSFCSKKSNLSIKNLRPVTKELEVKLYTAKRYRVDFEIFGNVCTMMQAMSMEWGESIQHITIDNCSIPMKQEENGCWSTFWYDKETGLKTILEYLTDLFKTPVTGLFFLREPWIIDYMRGQYSMNPNRKVLKNLWFQSPHYCSDLMMHGVLTHCLASNTVIFATPSLNFRYSGIFPSMDSFQISYAHWFTIDNLVALDAHQILVAMSKITSQDVNRFLKHWISGGSLRLKQMELSKMEFVNFEVVLEGLTWNRVEENVARHFNLSEGSSREFIDGFQIQRNDESAIASLAYDQAKNKIIMVVWPNNYQ